MALAGGFYVAELLGTGRDGAVVAAAGMMGVVAVANAIGLHVTARLQLGLAGLLAALLLVASSPRCRRARAENWTPFAPHGWGAVGTAASLLMLSFIGWEAVSHLAGELRDPARQLPRAIFFALGRGRRALPRAGRRHRRRARHRGAVERPARRPDGRGPRRGGPDRHRRAGRAADDGDDERLRRGGREARRALWPPRARRRRRSRGRGARSCCSPSSPRSLLAALATDLLGLDGLIRACSAAFVAVYVTSTAAGVRLLSGAGRRLAAVSFACGAGRVRVLRRVPARPGRCALAACAAAASR